MSTQAAVDERILPSNFDANSKIVQVPLDEVQVDRSYQRDLSMRLVDEIANNWDEVASELVMISDRGVRKGNTVKGGYWIVNGQHRTAAARKLGHKKIIARVIDLTKEKDPAALEAGLRLKTNVRLGDRPLERFKARVRAGDTDSIALVKLLEKYDTEINEVPQIDAGINAIAAVETLYRVDNGGLLRETLDIIKEGWGVVGGKSTSSAMMKAIAWFTYKHMMEVDRTRFIERIGPAKGGAGSAAIDRRARTLQSTLGGTLWMNYYRSLVDIYNERLPDKSKLDFSLRGASSFSVGGAWGADRS